MRNPIYLLKFIGSLFRLTRNLENLDYVLEMQDGIMKIGKKDEIQAVIDQIKKEPVAVQAIEKQFRFPRDNGQAFLKYSPGTLGHEYGQFLLRNGISPASFPDYRIQSEADYMVMHLYETHDLWHVLTGYETGIEEELELQAFYMSHTPAFLPVFIWVAALLNTVFFANDKKNLRLESLIRGWQRGKKAKNLIGVDWKQHLDRPLSLIQSEFRLEQERKTENSIAPAAEAFA